MLIATTVMLHPAARVSWPEREARELCHHRRVGGVVITHQASCSGKLAASAKA